jgi:hypothetical protein
MLRRNGLDASITEKMTDGLIAEQAAIKAGRLLQPVGTED